MTKETTGVLELKDRKETCQAGTMTNYGSFCHAFPVFSQDDLAKETSLD
jgi:hypothetical protein